jgi:hypothetical protein
MNHDSSIRPFSAKKPKKPTSHISIPILEGLERTSIFHDFVQTIPRTYGVNRQSAADKSPTQPKRVRICGTVSGSSPTSDLKLVLLLLARIAREYSRQRVAMIAHRGKSQIRPNLGGLSKSEYFLGTFPDASWCFPDGEAYSPSSPYDSATSYN